MLVFLIPVEEGMLSRPIFHLGGEDGRGRGRSVCPFGLFVDSYCEDLGCLRDWSHSFSRVQSQGPILRGTTGDKSGDSPLTLIPFVLLEHSLGVAYPSCPLSHSDKMSAELGLTH